VSRLDKLASQIEDLYLTNRYESGNDYYKFLPTQGEDPSLKVTRGNDSGRYRFRSAALASGRLREVSGAITPAGSKGAGSPSASARSSMSARIYAQ
jgi:hypothetical protein